MFDSTTSTTPSLLYICSIYNKYGICKCGVRDQLPFQWARTPTEQFPREGPGVNRGERQLRDDALLRASSPRRHPACLLSWRLRTAQDQPGRAAVGFATLTKPTTRSRNSRVADADPMGSASATRSSWPVDATRPQGPPSGWRSPHAYREAPRREPLQPHTPGSDLLCRACRRRTPPQAERFCPSSQAM